ncbi:cobaltochelatase subunit CobN [Stutzerimonas stutzeri]|uniref:Cobaltochelatase subunit CobN n=1 Tax=Stutzerimonas stutzeri TaxID=316 RepID=A0A2S4AI53_STUST|nr:cobaltochelatase subunit CobN [Stutzerimonas stutzeri]MCQ4263779.1 cobaltochelatase subunit CobN [Stutzerimonas stutzeri]POH81168.1 cobaltochelatase subunit CobN [Stutzerimonas stutzeri]
MSTRHRLFLLLRTWHLRLLRALHGGLWLAVLLLTCTTASAEQRLLFLAAAPVQAGKFEKLKPVAAEAGFILDYRMLDHADQVPTREQLGGYDLLIIDAPYGAAQGMAQQRAAPLLEGQQMPWLWLRRDGSRSNGLPAELVKALDSHYTNGGVANFSGFFCRLGAHTAGGSGDGCAVPQIHPPFGIYHPQAQGRIFNGLDDFVAWKGVGLGDDQPVIGLLFHKAYMDSGLTGFIDASVARIEAAGALAVPMFTSAMGNGEITRLLSAGGKQWGDVLINMQIMLNANGRKAEFEALGIPVLQAMPYRAGEQADWEADAQGLAAQDIPFYLAQPEFAGLVDPLFAASTRQVDGDIVPIERQLQAVVAKAMRLVRLRHLPVADIKSAILFYNYPPGEKNLGASFLNVPRSLERLLAAYAERGYDVEVRSEAQLIEELTGLLAPFHRDAALAELVARDRAARLPLDDYLAWFSALPERLQTDIRERWGEPEQAGLLFRENGQAFFAIPRLQLGKQLLMPQPPRGERLDDREKALYHDTKAPPSHSYLAAYLWLRQQQNVDALVHFGTHGSAEWQPGKERGLDVLDYPYLVLGDLPAIYPYIVDNIGEALQAKRRGRALILSHNTPSFGPAGLHGSLNELHDLLHEWLNMTEGEVRSATAQRIRSLAGELNLNKDLAIDLDDSALNMALLVDELHLHLHDLALQQQPLGLARFGVPAESDLRLLTVQQMLGKPLLEALAPEDPEELLLVDYEQLRQTPVWQLLDQHVREGQPWAGDEVIAELLQRARQYWRQLENDNELSSFFDALQGKHGATSYGGDPIKNPDSLPTGRNLYGFDPSRIPTREAWEAGKLAAERLLEQHRQSHGEYPRKLAFTLWSVETMRHFGLLEAQVLALMGFRPLWDEGGRVTGIEEIAAGELQRPRVDTVVSATGLYRDQFPQVMHWLAQAANQASELEEPNNPVAANSQAIELQLRAAGMPVEDARLAARTRIFSSESGAYGTGLEDATLASDSFGEGEEGGQDRASGEKKLARMYLDRMQFAYGPDASRWGEKSEVNLYAEQLRGVEGAVLSRSSNLYGMLTTDDPFQYLGGIGLAVRHLDGRAPTLYISNLRDAGNPRSETASGFLARDLRTRYLHPGWIKQVQQEGYSGTLEVLGSANNLWGWQVTAPETVRDDQWQEYKAVYLDDKYNLQINEWFEQHNPHAQAQLIERMLEAARKEYWHTDAQTLQQLAERYQQLAERFDVRSDNQRFNDYVAGAAAGFGLLAPGNAAGQPVSEDLPSPSAELQPVQGQRLDKQAEAEPVEPAPFEYTALIGLLLILLAAAGGALSQARRRSP